VVGRARTLNFKGGGGGDKQHAVLKIKPYAQFRGRREVVVVANNTPPSYTLVFREVACT
jgi:hypothetical protein